MRSFEWDLEWAGGGGGRGGFVVVYEGGGGFSRGRETRM